MKKKWIKVLVIIGITVAVATGGYMAYNKFFGRSKVMALSNRHITATAAKMDMDVNIQGTGSAFAGTSKEITVSNDGVIQNLNVQIGDTVKKGDTLFVANSDTITEALSTAKNNVEKQQSAINTANTQRTNRITEAQNTVKSAENQLNAANKELAEHDTEQAKGKVNSAKENLEKQKLALENAKNTSTADTTQLTNAQEQYNRALETYNKMTIKAPISGVVVAKNFTTGDDVQSGKAVLTIIDPNSIKVKVSVDELDIAKVNKGQTAQVKFDAISDTTFDGTVEDIAQLGTSNNNVTTYDVTLGVANPTGIKVGMNANITISIESKKDALVIPIEALTEEDSKKYVTIVNQGSGEEYKDGTDTSGQKVEVKTGMENESYVEITEGVEEGQKLLITLPSSSSSTNKNSERKEGFGGNSMGGGAMGGSLGGGSMGGAGNSPSGGQRPQGGN